jgi:hypothetical protein
MLVYLAMLADNPVHAGALMEAQDLNDWFAHGYVPAASGEPSGRIKARTASFCTERE